MKAEGDCLSSHKQLPGLLPRGQKALGPQEVGGKISIYELQSIINNKTPLVQVDIPLPTRPTSNYKNHDYAFTFNKHAIHLGETKWWKVYPKYIWIWISFDFIHLLQWTTSTFAVGQVSTEVKQWSAYPASIMTNHWCNTRKILLDSLYFLNFCRKSW